VENVLDAFQQIGELKKDFIVIDVKVILQQKN